MAMFVVKPFVIQINSQVYGCIHIHFTLSRIKLHALSEDMQVFYK